MTPYRDAAPAPPDELDVAQQLVVAEKRIAHLEREVDHANQRADYEARERVRLENAQHERWSGYTELRVELRAARDRAFRWWLYGVAFGAGTTAIVLLRWGLSSP